MTPKSKGMGGEYEMIAILQARIDAVCLKYGYRQVRLERNLEQSRARVGNGNGSDIVGLDWMAAEVKRREQEGASIVDVWWAQTKAAAMGIVRGEKGGNTMALVREPILFYRKNRLPWEVRMYGALTPYSGCVLKAPVDVSLPNFLVYFDEKVRHEFEMESKDRGERNAARVRMIRREANGRVEMLEGLEDELDAEFTEVRESGNEGGNRALGSHPANSTDPIRPFPHAIITYQIPEPLPIPPPIPGTPKKPWE